MSSENSDSRVPKKTYPPPRARDRPQSGTYTSHTRASAAADASPQQPCSPARDSHETARAGNSSPQPDQAETWARRAAARAGATPERPPTTATVCDHPKACQYRGEANLPAQRNSWSQLRDGASHHVLAPSFPGQTPSRATRFRTRSGSRDPGTHSPRAPPMPAHPCRRRARPARAARRSAYPPAHFGLEQRQQRRLARTGTANKQCKRTLGNTPIKPLEHRCLGPGIGKTKASHLNRRRGRAICHTRRRAPIQPSHQPNLFSSIACNTQGSTIQAAYTA